MLHGSIDSTKNKNFTEKTENWYRLAFEKEISF